MNASAGASAFLPELTFTDDFGFDLMQTSAKKAPTVLLDKIDRQTEELMMRLVENEQQKVGFGPVSNVLTMFLSLPNSANSAA